MRTVSKIKEDLKNCKDGEFNALLSELASDERSGVKKAVEAEVKRREALKAERARIEELKFFEKKYAEYSHICGIDEAGRGPLAGPVVAGAVIFPKDVDILYINDSKKLSAKRRDALYDEIIEKALAWGVGVVDNERIDAINIRRASFEAMRIALSNLSVEPDLILVDAFSIPEVETKQVAIVKGDAKSISIGAASIIAKVTRDRMMEEYDRKYPGYGFAQHKAYGTKAHYEALRQLGPSPIHRMTFLKPEDYG